MYLPYAKSDWSTRAREVLNPVSSLQRYIFLHQEGDCLNESNFQQNVCHNKAIYPNDAVKCSLHSVVISSNVNRNLLYFPSGVAFLVRLSAQSNGKFSERTNLPLELYLDSIKVLQPHHWANETLEQEISVI